ncbi:MFS transporter [Streptomyces capillispiralis]|uniref:MFS transporter n=1 Tax=Streptomyces capillispiralis TaxID=68182 RepID=A0A561TLI0_9ACTN|nr:MFS transporter [Streptomyces capillispiralis]TWF87900.1 MFS transporter [Streptomyces capillispiralis]GHH95009.1 MFS transporter [Streptomyces capillispiralis]
MASADRRRALALLACTQFVLLLDTSIINVAAPSIGESLDISPAALSWVANAYLVSFGGLLLLSGRAADLLGQRAVFAAGLGVLSAASLLGALSDSAALLITARAVQGVGAAMAGAAAFALVLTLFEGGPERHRALGVFAAMAGAGGAAGTVLGGVLTSWLGWESTFVLNVLAGAALLLPVPRLLPSGTSRAADRSAAPAGRGFDVPGAVTVTAGLGLLAFAVVNAGEAGWNSTPTLATGAAAVLLLAAFVLIERRVPHPLVPLAVLARPTLRLANVLAALWQVSLFPMFFLVSLYLQAVLGYEPVLGGLALLPLCLVVITVASLTDRLIGRFGLRAVMGAGFALVAVGMAWQSLLSADGSFVTDVLPPSLVLGVALPLVSITANVAATLDTREEEAGLASGLVNTSLQFGSVIGLAVLSGVAAARTDASSAAHDVALTEGFGTALLIGAVPAVVALLLTFRLRLPAPDAPAPPETVTAAERRRAVP